MKRSRQIAGVLMAAAVWASQMMADPSACAEAISAAEAQTIAQEAFLFFIRWSR